MKLKIPIANPIYETEAFYVNSYIPKSVDNDCFLCYYLIVFIKHLLHYDSC